MLPSVIAQVQAEAEVAELAEAAGRAAVEEVTVKASALWQLASAIPGGIQSIYRRPHKPASGVRGRLLKCI